MVWEEVQEAIAQMDQKEDATTIEPVHDHLRGMLLLGRSHIQPRDYPMIFKATGHGAPYNTIKNAMLESCREFLTLKGNQGSFGSGRGKRDRRHTGYGA